jgi:hypothetical protein
METKQCGHCKEIKSVHEFCKRKGTKTGYRSACKVCDKIWEISRKYDLKTRFRLWKKGAKIRHKDFTITLQDLEDLEAMPQVCFYTGRNLVFEPNHYDTISLDRVDNTKGYTKDNVVFSCEFINYMKRDLTYDQFIYACRLVAETHDSKIKCPRTQN